VTTPGTARPGDHLGDPAPVTEIRVAATAADAARSTPGVAHLQPGLWGLVHHLGNELWTRVTEQPRPDTAGIEVRIDGGTLTIDVTLVADGRRPVSVVAGDVQRNVYLAVRATHDIEPRQIAIHVIDIALPA
jgi:uncharacterized alkaline shock family protein YloU